MSAFALMQALVVASSTTAPTHAMPSTATAAAAPWPALTLPEPAEADSAAPPAVQRTFRLDPPKPPPAGQYIQLTSTFHAVRPAASRYLLLSSGTQELEPEWQLRFGLQVEIVSLNLVIGADAGFSHGGIGATRWTRELDGGPLRQKGWVASLHVGRFVPLGEHFRLTPRVDLGLGAKALDAVGPCLIVDAQVGRVCGDYYTYHVRYLGPEMGLGMELAFRPFPTVAMDLYVSADYGVRGFPWSSVEQSDGAPGHPSLRVDTPGAAHTVGISTGFRVGFDPSVFTRARAPQSTSGTWSPYQSPSPHGPPPPGPLRY